MEDEKHRLLKKISGIIDDISSISDYRCSVKRQFCSLARRLKLLAPMFDEIKDSEEPLCEDTLESLAVFAEALDSAKDCLRFGSQGSKIYLVLNRDQIMKGFLEIIANLEQALDGIPYDKLDISDKIREQVELVISQFRRAKGRIDTPDIETYEDLSFAYRNIETAIDPALLRGVTERLNLTGINDLMQESLALHEMVFSTGGDPDDSIERMSMLLKKIKDFVQTENPLVDSSAGEGVRQPSCHGRASAGWSQKSIAVPADFCCPISLELMRDPVIVSTGQTYERSFIEKWLESGRSTCPNTQQNLTTHTLTPNYALRSLISQWSESNGLEPPKTPTTSTLTNPPPSSTKHALTALIPKLTSPNPDHQRSAAGELRLLAKRSAHNRLSIAESGSIPPLVGLLTTHDSRTQEHAVTALLNLSICEENKGPIVFAGAVPGIVRVLETGSMEARENAAAALFSLSVVDEVKVLIGNSGAVPPLVALLKDGTPRGKKDAATALFNLCIYHGNKGKAIWSGVIPTLVAFLREPGGGMVDEALAILAILSSHQEGRVAIADSNALPVLVDVVASGSARNKENAVAVLGHLCSHDPSRFMAAVRELGLKGPLAEVARSGTERGKRKAKQLLERMNRCLETKDQTRVEEHGGGSYPRRTAVTLAAALAGAGGG